MHCLDDDPVEQTKGFTKRINPWCFSKVRKH